MNGIKFEDAVNTNRKAYNNVWKLNDLKKSKELFNLAEIERWIIFTIKVKEYQEQNNLIPSGILTAETLDNIINN